MSRNPRQAADRRAGLVPAPEGRRILVLDADAKFAASLRRLLVAQGHSVEVTADVASGIERLHSFAPAVLLIDVTLAAADSTFDRFTAVCPNIVCVTMGKTGQRARGLAAMRRGAYDHYDKTAGAGELEAILRRAFDRHDMAGSLTRLLADRDRREQALHEARAEAERAAQEARTAHARLVDAFEVVSEGLVLFDADDRLVMWNRRYAELFEFGDALTPGMSFEDLLRARLASSNVPVMQDDPEAWFSERLARHRAPANTHEQELPGDHWLRIEERRTADGGNIGVRIDITDLKRREASFRLLFESNPVPMWIYDRESLRFLAVNDTAVAHYGYAREQFLNMTLLDIRPPEDWDDLRRNNPEEKAHSDGGRTWRHIKADGTMIEVAVFSRSIPYGNSSARLVAIVDVSDRKRVEDELRRTRGFLNSVFETVPVEILVKDARDLSYVLVNQAVEQQHGIPREKIIGKTSRDIFRAEFADLIEGFDRAALASRKAHFADAHVLEHDDVSRIVTSTRLPIFGDDGTPQYLVTVVHDITERRRAEERVAHMAYHDALTELPNRAAFNEHFAELLARAGRDQGTFAVMCLDLDRLKETNDVFGHSLGDALLRLVSRRLKAAAGRAFLARLGGDEFAILYEDGTAADCAELAQKLLDVVSEEIEIEGHKLQIGLSVGIALFPNDGTDETSLFGNADAALYRAKAEGRGSVRFFEADMDKHLRERRALVHDLRAAVVENQFTLHYQPQARIGGEVIGFEALARWRHPTRGLVLPGTFIPIAEESGLILSIGESILRQACHEASSWPRPLNLAVNVSPVQFRHGNLAGLVHSVLLESGLAPHRLELEVTESVLIDDFARAVAILRRLKALGVRIAIDDFGTGYSSLLNLQSIPFDKIKIDMAFIAKIERNPQAATIVRAVIGLAHGLGLPVLAEGVETEAQQAFLACEACDEMQGYLVGRPAPIEDYAEVLGRYASCVYPSAKAS
ncbi:MAG TPA: EAL domain-containing protein [Xanthobacteraceae bacterium]|nr:EAL domain-containing protein [Xanthobacteraceae bacterium]